ncbi:MAG: Gfo/Idh/MocA family protein [bacterium]
MRHLQWGLIGAGRIAGKFADGLATLEGATALAIGSRSLEKAQRFAHDHQVERACGSYEEVLDEPDVDAVYIALPNAMHAEWSIRAAEAGKHILCEKPAAVNAPQLQRVLDVVRRRDVFFMEAFMYRCHPQWGKLLELLDQGAIGEVRLLHSAFAFKMGMDLENIRMRNELAGGGLMDVGCYCVSFCRLVAGEEPIECKAVAHIGEEGRVDYQMTGVLKFPSGICAYFTSAIQCSVPTSAVVYGSEGHIEVASPWFPNDQTARLIVRAGGEPVTHSITTGRELYANEALTVARYLDQRQAPRPCMSWEDSLGQGRTLDALRQSMGLRFDGE